jgi:cytochrome c oxidase subunit 1
LVGVDDPWGWGRSLEWATSSPPPRHNFIELPRIRSESPAFDRHHLELALAECHPNRTPADNLLDAGDDEGRVENLEENIEQEHPDTPGHGGDSSE